MAQKNGAKLTAAQRAKCRSGKVTPEILSKYLELYASGMPSGHAATAVGITLTTISDHKEKNPEFKKRWQKAYDAFTDVLEKRAEDMALQCQVNSPTMLIFMLKARRPHVYRDNVKMEHSGTISFAAEFAAAMQRVDSGVAATQH